MTIMSNLQGEEAKRKAAQVAKLREAIAAVKSSGNRAGDLPALAGSSAEGGSADNDGKGLVLPAEDAVTTTGDDDVERNDRSALSLSVSEDDVQEYSNEMTAKVLADLTSQASLHRETMAIIESSQQWKDYDSHVSFELLMLKNRYASSPDIAMTAERRAQMQAHLRAKQAQIMEMHADKAAEAYLLSLTSDEKEALARKLLRVEIGLHTDSAARQLAAEAAAEAMKEKGNEKTDGDDEDDEDDEEIALYSKEQFGYGSRYPSVSDKDLRSALEALSVEASKSSKARRARFAAAGLRPNFSSGTPGAAPWKEPAAASSSSNPASSSPAGKRALTKEEEELAAAAEFHRERMASSKSFWGTSTDGPINTEDPKLAGPKAKGQFGGRSFRDLERARRASETSDESDDEKKGKS